MSKRTSKKVLRELTFLAALDRFGTAIDTSKITEVQDWSGAIVGGFYGAFVSKPARARKLLSGLIRGFRRPDAGPGIDRGIAARRTEPSRAEGIFAVPARIEQEVGDRTLSVGTIAYAHMANPQLVAECLKMTEGSWGSWTEFVRRTQPLICAAVVKASRRVGKVSREAIDDLVQDTYLKLCANEFSALRRFETLHENALFEYLKVVASYVVRDHFRQQAAHQERSNPDMVLAGAAADQPGPSLAERGLFLSAIDKALKTLSSRPNFERDRTVFWLYYGNGLTAKEISSLPGIGLTREGVESVLLQQTRLIRAAFQESPRADLTKSPKERH